EQIRALDLYNLMELGRRRGGANQQRDKCRNGLHERRSLIDCKISAIASARGLAPRLPLPWTRTLTASASMSRFPITNMVWTFICSARWILPLMLSLLLSISART